MTDSKIPLIFGHKGRVGSALMRMFPGAQGIDAEGGVIHHNDRYSVAILAQVRWDNPAGSAADIARALLDVGHAKIPRVIYCSSVNADPDGNGRPDGMTPYGLMKLQCEAMVRAWAGQPHRAGINLRLGAFGHMDDLPWHLSESGLRYWVDRAMDTGPGTWTWTATGWGESYPGPGR